jgi:hypothetical protein
MKKVLLLMVAVLMISSVAMATPHYGVYTDCSGSSCALAAGFTQTVAVVEKLSTGTTGSRFKVVLPAGSNFFGFTTPYVPIGNLTNDLSLGYGVCLTGTNCLGTIAGILAPGVITVQASDGFPNIIYTDCSFGEFPGHGGTAYVGSAGDCNEPNAAQPSTWGQVKALYR